MVYAACYCAIRGIVAAARSRTARATCARSGSTRPAGTIVNPVLPGRLRRARRDRLPRLRRDHGRARADRARPRDRRRRGRADADRLRRLRRGRPAVRARPRCSSAAGARARASDGLEGVSNPLANLGNQPVELIEADLPLRGRPLRARAGLGRRRAATAAGSPTCASTGCSPSEATLTIRTDRRDHPPYGLDGGEPGAPVEQRRRLGRRGARAADDADGRRCTLERGDVFTPRLGRRRRLRRPVRARPGGRARGRARREGRRVAAARERYGVVLSPTGRRRRRRRRCDALEGDAR